MKRDRIRFDLLIHDLKGPLAVIEAGIRSLLMREDKYGTLTESQKKVLKRVLRNTKITQTLVNDALEIERSNVGIINRNRLKLSYLINECLVELFDIVECESSDEIRNCTDLDTLKQLLKRSHIYLDIEKGLWTKEIQTDQGKLRQILRNLLSNALKYRKEKVHIKLEGKDRYLQISVIDDGEGIPGKYHKDIFKCYFQMNQNQEHCIRGHGLGLAGVMILVEDMGGELSLESDIGKGAKFAVKIPIEGL